jgi:hypothetical protein
MAVTAEIYWATREGIENGRRRGRAVAEVRSGSKGGIPELLAQVRVTP